MPRLFRALRRELRSAGIGSKRDMSRVKHAVYFACGLRASSRINQARSQWKHLTKYRAHRGSFVRQRQRKDTRHRRRFVRQRQRKGTGGRRRFVRQIHRRRRFMTRPRQKKWRRNEKRGAMTMTRKTTERKATPSTTAARVQRSRNINGYLHTATSYQSLANREGFIDTMQGLIGFLEWWLRSFACPKKAVNWNNRRPCHGTSLFAPPKGAKDDPYKDPTVKEYQRRSFASVPNRYKREDRKKAGKGSETGSFLGEGTYSLDQSNRSLQCAGVSHSRQQAQGLCSSVQKETFAKKEADDWLANAMDLILQHPETKELLPMIKQGIAVLGDGQESGHRAKTKFAFAAKLHMMVAKKLKQLGAKIIPLVIPHLIKKFFWLDQKKYECLCVGYIGQLVDPNLRYLTLT